MIKAVIFDMDGVILDSVNIHLKATKKAFGNQGITLTEKEMIFISARNPFDFNKALSKKYKYDTEKFVLEHRKYYSKDYGKARFFSRTKRLIFQLNKLKVPIAMDTSSTDRMVRQVEKRMPLEKIFDVIVTFNDCSKRKPAPDSYLMAAKRLKVNPKECLVFEDSQIGVEAAKRAKMKCVALPNRYTLNHDFSKADLVIKPNQKIEWARLKEFFKR
ncbi:MAG: HAD family phosphatase [Candidatus Woesearchaeota archaeon]